MFYLKWYILLYFNRISTVLVSKFKLAYALFKTKQSLKIKQMALSLLWINRQ